MRAIRLYNLLVLVVSLASFTLAVVLTGSIGLAGKPAGNGGGGGEDPPPTVDFAYELVWLPRELDADYHPRDVNNTNIMVGSLNEYLNNEYQQQSKAFVHWDPTIGVVLLDDLIPNHPDYSFEIAGQITEEINGGAIIAGWAWEHTTSAYRVFRYAFNPISPSGEFEIITKCGDLSKIQLNEAGDVAFQGQAADEVIVKTLAGESTSYFVPGLGTTSPQSNIVSGLSDFGHLLVNSDAGCVRLSIFDKSELLFRGYDGRVMNSWGSFCATKPTQGKTKNTLVRFEDPDQEISIAGANRHPMAINNFGDVLISYNGGSGWKPYLFTDLHGYLDVSQLLTNPNDADWIAASHVKSQCMNDHGDIYGYSVMDDGRYAAFALIRVAAAAP